VERTRDAGRRLLVLGEGPAQLGLLAGCAGARLFVIACDRDPAAPGFRHADRRAIVSTEDEPRDRAARLRRAGRQASSRRGATGRSGIAARVAEKLGIPHPLSPASAVLATSKMRQRERFAVAGVPQPRHAVCRDLGEAEEAVRELGLPVRAEGARSPGPEGTRARAGAGGAPRRRHARALRVALRALPRRGGRRRAGGDGQRVLVGREVHSAHGHRPRDRRSAPPSASRSRTSGRAGSTPRP